MRSTSLLSVQGGTLVHDELVSLAFGYVTSGGTVQKGTLESGLVSLTARTDMERGVVMLHVRRRAH